MRMDSPPRIKMKMMKRFEARSPMRRSIIVPIHTPRMAAGIETAVSVSVNDVKISFAK